MIRKVKRDRKIEDYDKVRIRIASPDSIREWSHGEVVKPDTLNYRTLKPEKGGLFCERIFGPEKDYECACGKYKKKRFEDTVCDRCGVEITSSRVRRYPFQKFLRKITGINEKFRALCGLPVFSHLFLQFSEIFSAVPFMMLAYRI